MSSKSMEVDIFATDLIFSAFTSEEIKKMSVVKIVTGLTFDPLGYPLPGGLYDSAMGAYGRSMERCATCLNIQGCPGHMGHIELNALVYNPFFISAIQKILGVCCLNCFKLQIREHILKIVVLQLRLIKYGFIIEAQELENYKSELACRMQLQGDTDVNSGDLPSRLLPYENLLQNANECKIKTKTSSALRTSIVHAILQRPTSKKCLHCNKQLRNVRYLYKKLVYYVPAAELKSQYDSQSSTGANKVVLAEICRDYLKQVYDEYTDLLLLLFPILDTKSNTKCPVDLFFLSTLPVTPPKARPVNIMRDEIIEHAQTGIYRNIIENYF